MPRECRSIPQISFWGMPFPQMLKCTKLFPLWLHTRPSWGSLQCFPRLPSWIYGSLLLGKEGEKERERRAKEGERLGERRGGKVDFRAFSHFQICHNTTARDQDETETFACLSKMRQIDTSIPRIRRDVHVVEKRQRLRPWSKLLLVVEELVSVSSFFRHLSQCF